MTISAVEECEVGSAVECAKSNKNVWYPPPLCFCINCHLERAGLDIYSTPPPHTHTEPVVYGPRETIPRNEFRQPVLPGGRYDNPIPPWFLAPIDCLKIPVQFSSAIPIQTSRLTDSAWG
jgi:hypothetical protein